MRLLSLLTAALLPLALAQSATPSSANATSFSSGSSTASAHVLVTTTLTSFVSSGTTSQPITVIETVTVDATSSATASSATATAANATATMANTTAVAWNATDDWLPFNVTLDPAYGVAGALLITTGLPVAALGGKNRWSSLAIATGYSLSLFTLVLILSLGVEPAIQPPSPNPPTAAMRGLYLLACAFACIAGSGLGVFFFNIARHWVGAVGGFAFGWFLLATKSGGLVDTIAGRWGLVGGMTVAWLFACIVPVLTPYAVLVSTAWAGATAFVLGIDCYTRAGLKEFYVYNLGYHDLFPSLNGASFPLTQTMQVELGVIAATALFRVVNVLQQRLKKMREEEESRIEADQVAQAAERFKNMESDLGEWEKKHGDGTTSSRDSDTYPGSMALADRSSVLLPTLSHDRRTSPLSLHDVSSHGDYTTVRQEVDTPTTTLPAQGQTSLFEELGLKSPESAAVSPTTPTDPELAGQMRLLEEVRRTRAEIRRSMDQLRSATPTSAGLSDPRMSMSSARLLDDRPSMDRQYSTSAASPLDARRPSADARRLSTSSSRLLDAEPRRPSDLHRQSPELLAPRRSTPSPDADAGPPRSEWDSYVAERKLVRPPRAAGRTQPPRSSSMVQGRVSDFGPDAAAPRAIQTVPSRPTSQVDPVTGRRRDSYLFPLPPNGSPSAPVITGSAARPAQPTSRPPSQQFPRTMTYDELAERHRSRLSRLQEPLSAQMREQEDLARAKSDWEARKKAERTEMARREKDKAGRAAEPLRAEGTDDRRGKQSGAAGQERVRASERRKSTDEWRRSVGGLDQVASAPKRDGPARPDRRRSQAWAS